MQEGYLEEELWSRRYAQTFDDSSDEERRAEQKMKMVQYKLNLDPTHSSHMEFLHTILRPLIDTYTFSAFTLRKLVGRSLAERDLVQEVLSEIKTNLDRGIVSYGTFSIFFSIINISNKIFRNLFFASLAPIGESLCVDPIKNSFKLFEKWNVLECHPEQNVRIVYLKDEYDNDRAANEIYETIETFKWTRNVD